ncbi:uncharacterized protein G2W53_020569 [Senna tora]|uniref:Uncharacterized protein n=1 Tax=Senna tora TaxID=362788 RepID=A0A834U0J0_9FABA|nr:uncharacterized protein G2W53_020569 [Senna tora]
MAELWALKQIEVESDSLIGVNLCSFFSSLCFFTSEAASFAYHIQACLEGG